MLLLRAIQRAQAKFVDETERMNRLEFAPAQHDVFFRDVSASLEGLERAKSAVRAMGKYVPMDLVRRLYLAKSEPVLGGEMVDVSIMFTDIKGFTTISEQLSPNELAGALGRYLEVMARIIQDECQGTIDKYIGDAIMTIWNAPSPVAQHATMACRAALKCLAAGERLSTSPEWRGIPPFVTRFGLHRDRAMVGHYGSPNRMNYTAIGDGVNLASRLEGLNKQYGTSIMASETIREAAGGEFAFRLLDVVAVKGKSQGVKVYELVGFSSELTTGRRESIAAYERAFDLYRSRDFKAALAIFESLRDDEPSRVLAERCRTLLATPPQHGWSGVFESTEK
ncbi:MAG: hypothetical protein HY075_14125 [Deltaproteobacteria bacterium]|nr:hypothetical protein [Deltaproteobacteria bacterium]